MNGGDDDGSDSERYESTRALGSSRTMQRRNTFSTRARCIGEGLQDLREGDSVEFDVGEGPKGPRAENVRRTST